MGNEITGINEKRDRVHAGAYAQAGVGTIQNAAHESYENLGATLGGQVEYKGTYLQGEVGAGTALTAEAEIGHNFDLGSNMGLTLSANAKISRSMKQNSSDTQLTTTTSVIVNGKEEAYYESQLNHHREWNPGEKRLGAGAVFTFGSKNARFGIGVEGGIRKNTVPDINASLINIDNYNIVNANGQQYTVQATAETTIPEKHNVTKGFLTAKLSANVEMGKGFSFVAEADRYQRKAGVRWTF